MTALIAMSAASIGGVAIWALVERTARYRAETRVKAAEVELKLALSMAEATTAELARAQDAYAASNGRLESVIAVHKKEISELMAMLEKCNDPEDVRTRLRQLFGGAV